MVRRDEVGVDREAEDPETRGEVVLPDGRVPLGRAALQLLAAPDVVDEHVDVAQVVADLLGQLLHLTGIEMVDGAGDPGAAQVGHELGRLLDRLGPVVVRPGRPGRSGAATGAHHRRARLAQRGRDATPGAAGGAGDDGDATTKCVSIRGPCHSGSLPDRRAADALRRRSSGGDRHPTPLALVGELREAVEPWVSRARLHLATRRACGVGRGRCLPGTMERQPAVDRREEGVVVARDPVVHPLLDPEPAHPRVERLVLLDEVDRACARSRGRRGGCGLPPATTTACRSRRSATTRTASPGSPTPTTSPRRPTPAPWAPGRCSAARGLRRSRRRGGGCRWSPGPASACRRRGTRRPPRRHEAWRRLRSRSGVPARSERTTRRRRGGSPARLYVPAARARPSFPRT